MKQFGGGPGAPMRALFVLPSLRPGGAEAQTIELVNGVLPGECQKYLLCFDGGLDLQSRLNPESAVFLMVPRTRKLDWRLARRIAALIDEHGIDVVHCSLMIAIFWGWLGVFLSRRRPPIVAALHTTLNANFRADLFDYAIYQWILRGCARVIFVCDAQRKHWVARFHNLARQAVVVHNGVDPEWFRRDGSDLPAGGLRGSLGLGQRKVIAHIAGFRPEKGHAVLVEAFAQLCRERDDVVLVLAGDGPLRPAVEQQVARLGLQHCVRFLGVVPDVRPVLELAECSVLPSRAESFSMAMLESLAMEVPVVAADVGGTSEAVIPGRTGYLVPPGEPGALAAALRDCLRDPIHRRELGRAGRELVLKRFGRQQMLERTGDVLLEVVQFWKAARSV